MPLTGNIDYKRIHLATLRLIDILSDPDVSCLFNTTNNKFEQLIYAYPGLPRFQKPRQVKEIYTYIQSLYSDNLLSYIKLFEQYMKAIQKREHFCHQFETMLLGLYLIRKIIEHSPSLEVFGFNDKAEIYKTWLFTTIGHDFGYPAEVTNEILSKLSDLYNKIYLDSISQNLEIAKFSIQNSDTHKRLIRFQSSKDSGVVKSFFDIDDFIQNSLMNSLDLGEEEIRQEIIALKENNDHGFISALLTCRITIEKLVTKNHIPITELNRYDKYHYKMLNYASGAIACHNYENFYSSISFEKNPYAYLLVMLDNIHDWDRTLFYEAPYPNYILYQFEPNGDMIKIVILLESLIWSDEMVTNTKKFLEKKKKLFEMTLVKPKPPKGISILLEYISDNPRKLNKFSIRFEL